MCVRDAAHQALHQEAATEAARRKVMGSINSSSASPLAIAEAVLAHLEQVYETSLLEHASLLDAVISFPDGLPMIRVF